MKQKLTRRESQEQTRARLLKAAGRVFASRGYHGAAVPEIAEAAGLTTGAVYSNFEAKEDLFLTLMAEEMRSLQKQRLKSVLRIRSVPASIRDAAGLWLDFLERRPDSVKLLIEFWSYAVRNPAVRPRMAEEFRTVRSGLARVVENVARSTRTTAGYEAGPIAFAVQALAYGYAMLYLIDPERAPGELFIDALGRLVRGSIEEKKEDATEEAASAPTETAPAFETERAADQGDADLRKQSVKKTLGELRRELSVTQAALSGSLQVDQSEISRMERRSDPRLSTLRRYIEALGGELILTAVFPDGAVGLNVEGD